MPHLFKYSGGKVRQSSKIVEILESYRKPNQVYVEPFIGAGSVFSKMSGVRIGFDVNEVLVAYYHAIQSGWLPPENVSREEYQHFIEHKEEYSLPLQAFYGFACSFSGKWCAGYAYNQHRNYAGEAYRSTQEIVPLLTNAAIGISDYRELNFKDALIYCDPPYSNTTGYDATDTFDSKEFWKTMQQWAEHNTVFVTEFTAPSDSVEVVHEFTRKSTMDKNAKTAKVDIEYLYKVKPDEGNWW